MHALMILALSPTLNSILQFLTLLIVFVIILFATYWTTKFVGSYQKIATKATNFEVIETFRVAGTKYLQIVRAGEHYLVIAVSKEQITFLTELSKEEVVMPHTDRNESFGQILDKMKNQMNQYKNNYKKNHSHDLYEHAGKISETKMSGNSVDSINGDVDEEERQEGKGHSDEDE